jgi:Fe2+ transport system protein B
MRRFFITLVFALILVSSPSLARIGDNLDAAEWRYGKPTSVIKSSTQTIRIYETATGELKETYNQDGICIRSSIKHDPVKLEAIRRAQAEKQIQAENRIRAAKQAEASARLKQNLKQSEQNFQASLRQLDKELEQNDKDAEKAAQFIGVVVLGSIFAGLILFVLMVTLLIFVIKHLVNHNKRADKLTACAEIITNAATEKINPKDPRAERNDDLWGSKEDDDSRYMPQRQ